MSILYKTDMKGCNQEFVQNITFINVIIEPVRTIIIFLEIQTYRECWFYKACLF